VTVDTCGTAFDTLLAVYTGSSVGTLTTVAGSDDSDGCAPGSNQSLVAFNVTGGTAYSIAVDGFAGERGFVSLTLEFLEAPPPCPPPGVSVGATYRGSSAQGGIVCFTVTADWSAVTSFLITNLEGNGGSCTLRWAQFLNPPIPISNRSFSVTRKSSVLSGSFDAGKGATGTYKLVPFGTGVFCDIGVVSWNASTTASPPWTLPVAADRTAPAFSLRGRSAQRAIKQKGVVVEVQCPTEACTASARGSVSVPNVAKTYRLRSATKQIPKGGKAKLTLKFSKKALKAVKRALRKRKRIKARVTVTVKDVVGNGATKRLSIRLKR
jgi:hypothetical protein